MTTQDAAPAAGEPVADLTERTAQLIAHRVCCGTEHDPANGKLHGYCVVCGVPWPCEYAGCRVAPPDSLAVAQALKQAEQECYRERDKADAGEWQDASGSAWALGFGFACNLLGKRIRALIPSDLVAEALPTAQALEKAESPEQDEKA